MAGMVAIPQSMLGTTLNELILKSVLIRLNPGIHFDVGGNLNIWHPWQEGKQGVWFRGKHLCSMDRGQIPQAPIWSTKTEFQRVLMSECTFGELQQPMMSHEVEYLTDGTERDTGYVFIQREERDRLLWIGWQATLRKIINKDLPGITAATLTEELGVKIGRAHV